VGRCTRTWSATANSTASGSARHRRTDTRSHRSRALHRQPISRKDGLRLAEEAAARGATCGIGDRSQCSSQTDQPASSARCGERCRDGRGLQSHRGRLCDVVIMSAAVADYRPADRPRARSRRRTARLGHDLEPTEDILAWMGAHKPQRQVLVGFALETNDGRSPCPRQIGAQEPGPHRAEQLEDPVPVSATTPTRSPSSPKAPKPEALPLMSKAEVAVLSWTASKPCSDPCVDRDFSSRSCSLLLILLASICAGVQLPGERDRAAGRHGQPRVFQSLETAIKEFFQNRGASPI
jgi:hypothetical protein